jgi:Bacterial membrane protein YfhO
MAVPVPGIGPSYVVPQAARAAAILVLGTGALLAMLWSRWVEVGALAATAVVVADLWLFGFGYHPFYDRGPVHPSIPETRYLESVPGVRPRFVRLGGWWLPPNISLIHWLYEVEIYDNVIPSPMVDLLSVAQPNQRQLAPGNIVGNFTARALTSPVFDLLGVRHVVSAPRQHGFGDPSFRGVLEVFPQPGALPPAFITQCWRFLPERSVLEELRHMDRTDLRSTVLLVDEGTARIAAGRSPDGGRCPVTGSASIERFKPEQVTVEVATPRRAMLVLSEAWYPGWTATVDGSPAPVLRGDWALRAVPLPPGRHRVDLRYHPGWLPLGGGVTVAALLLVAGLLWPLTSAGSAPNRTKPIR